MRKNCRRRPGRAAVVGRTLLLAAGVTLVGGCGAIDSGLGMIGLGRGDDGVEAIRPSKVAADYRKPFKDGRPAGDALARTDVPRVATANKSIPAPPRPAAVAGTVVPPQQRSKATPAYDATTVLTAGGLVADVNGKPIFAHELLRLATPALRAQAGETTSPERFRAIAVQELKSARATLINNELVYAAALRNTSREEQLQAEALASMFRERLVSRAGGSEAVARQKARADGAEFDELLEQERRRMLAMIYFQKRVFPRSQLSVDEMRRHYEQNKLKAFTQPSVATFRLIEVRAADVGGPEKAVQRAEEARRRAIAGEDFARLASEYNREGPMRRNGGLVGPVTRGSWRDELVERAIWDTPISGVTPVVVVGNRALVAQVVDKKVGRTMSFDEPEVQRQIEASLREQKIAEVRGREEAILRSEAIVTADDAMLTPAIDLTMQMYPQWRGERAAK